MSRAALHAAALVLLAAACTAAPGSADPGSAAPGRTDPRSAPDDDWRGATPEERLRNAAQVGIVSYGPFPIANTTTDGLDALCGDGPWRALETAHLRLVSNLPKERPSRDEQAALEPVLERLRAAFPDLPREVKALDPWLRLHVLALRLEASYARIQVVLGVTDADFPAERAVDGPYMGDGRFLGVKGKFELVFHAERDSHQALTRSFMGGSATDAVRWYLKDPSRMIASVPAEDSDLRSDRWLYPHTTNLLAHLCLCAYKHFAYDPPIWIDAGLAHFLEREIEPVSTTLDGEEGSGPHRGGHQDWRGRDVRLARRGRHQPFARLMRVKAFGDLSVDDNVVCWSLVRFLVTEHPAELARFVGGVKGQLDERGYPTGRDLVGLQRRLLKEVWGWTPADLEEAWKAWLLDG